MAVLRHGEIVKVKYDRIDDLRRDLMELAKSEILVGFPDETATRTEEDGEKSPMTNAAIAYVQDNGAPEQNIPARPFMIPGIKSAQDRITDALGNLAKRTIRGGTMSVAQGLARVGSIAELAIKKKINEGIPPPLAESTLQDRARRGRKGAKLELANRAAGEAASTEFAKPLVDTAQMRNAVKYVIRPRKQRKSK